jgi:ferritin-like metal-binding protein YciE
MPPQIETPRELLLAQLGKLLTIEATLLKRVLPQLVRQLGDEQLKAVVAAHVEETRGHLGNVQQAFLALGAVPEGKPAPGLDGLVLEREASIGDIWPELRAPFDCAAAMGTEHYEINAYELAIRLADALGAEEVGALLRANLEQEIAALEQLGAQAERLTAATPAAAAS